METLLSVELYYANSTMSYRGRAALYSCGAAVSPAILQLYCGTEKRRRDAGATMRAPQNYLLFLSALACLWP